MTVLNPQKWTTLGVCRPTVGNSETYCFAGDPGGYGSFLLTNGTFWNSNGSLQQENNLVVNQGDLVTVTFD